MAIKSVREISFFQTLRDRELNLTLCSLGDDETYDKVAHFMHYLAALARKEMEQNQNSELSHMEKECINSLIRKLEVDNSNSLNLSFMEAIHLHNVLDFFENNYESFKKITTDSKVSNHLATLALMPSNYYNTIFTLKNKIENKLGEMVTNSYKFKHI